MAYNRITWLPQALRDAGITVIEHDGWETRGLSTSSPFEPAHVVWHHDASAPGDSPGVPDYMIRNFTNAGAQLWVDRLGRWHIIASGRAAHAGATRGGVTNYNSIGIETDHTTGEDWPSALLDSLRKGTKIILDKLRTTAVKGLHFHKTICDPPGRKVDPDGLDLARERQRVASVVLVDRSGWPVVSLARVQRAAGQAGWSRKWADLVATDVRRVRRALKEEGCIDYASWQRKLGYRGKDANGAPGEESLTKLGDQHKFRVGR